jgi:hypothetical protein
MTTHRPRRDPRPDFECRTSRGLPLLAVALAFAAAASAIALPEPSRQVLPPPVTNPHSTEICMNSRLSYHGGWSAAFTEQMLADILDAAARAPVTGAYRTIYAATAQNVYVYDAPGHSISVHKAGDWRSDATAAFEVGVAAEVTVDAGAAMHLAQLESIALWTGTASQLASCPRASAVTYANSHWDLPEPIDLATSFGIRAVAGLTAASVAISSDGSLPNPDTDGSVYLDDALASMTCDTTFTTDDLPLDQVSQLLWASYGCGNHIASGKGGLVCASAVANYYLTRRIYSVGATAVHRFHNRRPPGTDMTTRDHRIEVVTGGDARTALHQAVPRLPEAPHYLIICVGSTGSWQEVEVGFAAVGALLEASTLGLQGYVSTSFSTAEQAAIRTATGIPSGDLPMAVVALGRSGGGAGVEPAERRDDRLAMSIEHGIVAWGRATIHFELPMESPVVMTIRDCQGRQVRTLINSVEARGPHIALWDGLDDRGQPVLSGVYLCRLQAGGLAHAARLVVVR